MFRDKHFFNRMCLTSILIVALSIVTFSFPIQAHSEVIEPFTGDLDVTTYAPSVVKPGVSPLVMLPYNGSHGPIVGYDIIEDSSYADPDIVIYSDGTIWYDVDSIVRASRNSYSLGAVNLAAMSGSVHETYLPWKTVILDSKRMSELLKAISFDDLPTYKSRHFQYGHAPHRLLTYWHDGKVHTITVGDPCTRPIILFCTCLMTMHRSMLLPFLPLK